jgi:hypothetical protein
MTQPSSFERDSTKAPAWLLIVGVLLFVAITSLVATCPLGARPSAAPPAAPPAAQTRQPRGAE